MVPEKEATRIFKEAGLSDYRTIETDDDTAKTEEEKAETGPAETE